MDKIDLQEEVKNNVYEKGYQDGMNERDKQIRSWHKLPIKHQEEGKIGPIICDACGGGLYRVRAKFPNEQQRIICPTCAIEILEDIYFNLYPANQASSPLPSSSKNN